MIREWIYRHWDDVPREASYEAMKRARASEGFAPTPVDLAVDLISAYYNAGTLLGNVTTAKSTVEGGVFMRSPGSVLRLAAERYLDGTKSVLDIGSGNGFAVSVFSQYARCVRGVEIDGKLYEEGKKCVAELSGVVDGKKIDLVNGNFFDEDMSRYDLIYIYWPGYGDEDKEKQVWQALNEKLVREMKPGAVFVMLGGAGLPALGGLERLESLDPAHEISSVYRKPLEPAAEDSTAPGTEVANARNLQRLLGIINLLKKQKGIDSAKELIENWLRYLDERGLITTRSQDGKLIVTIKDRTFDHVDGSEPDKKKARSVMRVARVLRRWVMRSESGVNAINFKGTDGVWRIAGFESDLNDDVLKHEIREVELREQDPSVHWIEAHNKAVKDTGIGAEIDAEKIKGSRVERNNEIGSVFGGLFRRSGRPEGAEDLGYLKIMDKHGELDAEIQKLRKRKKVTSLGEIEMEKGKDLLKDAALFLKRESEGMRKKEVELMDAMQGVSENAAAIRQEMERIQKRIEYLRSATPEEESLEYSVSRTTIISGEEAYKNMLGYLGSMEKVKADGGMLDMLAEDAYRMIRCLEQLKVHSHTNTLRPDELQIMKDITIMLWWLFGKRDDGENAAAVDAARIAAERMLQKAVEGLRGHLENGEITQAAEFINSAYSRKMTTIFRALRTAEEGPGVSGDFTRKGNFKVFLSLWNGYLKNFAQMTESEVTKLSGERGKWAERHAIILDRRESYDKERTALVKRHIFIEEVAKEMGALLEDKGYLAGKRGIFICDTKSPTFVTGQDSHIEIDTGDIYFTKEEFERLLDVDPDKKTALAARLFQLRGERKALLEKAVEWCNMEIEFSHNKLRALRVELGDASNDQSKVQEVADKIRELSGRMVEMEKEENRISSGDDPAKILEWIRKKLNDPHQWVWNIGYMDFGNNYIEFTPNVKLLDQLLETHKEMLEAEIGFVERVYHPSVHRGALLDGLKAEIEAVRTTLGQKTTVIHHIHDINIGSMTGIFGSTGIARRHETTREHYAVIGGGLALNSAWWGAAIAGVSLVLLAGYRICRWLYLKGEFKLLIEKHPRLGRLLFRAFGINYEKAVSAIDKYYERGKKKGTVTFAKRVEQYGGIFMDSSMRELDVITRLLLTGREKVVDLGSGNAKAVAMFSQNARRVKGIEVDEALNDEGNRCIADLAGIVDPNKVELENGDFLDEKYEKDLAEADMVYIYWPSYNVSVGAGIMLKLQEKLVRLLKPGALFVVNNSGPVGDFERLEKVELPFDMPYGLTVYRNDPATAAWRAIEDERAATEEWEEVIRRSGRPMTLEDWSEIQRFRQALVALGERKKELIEKYGKLPGMGFKVEGGLGAICVDCAEKHVPGILNRFGFEAQVVHRQFDKEYIERKNYPPIHAYNIAEVCGKYFIIDIDADPFEGRNTGVVVIPVPEAIGTIYTEGFVSVRYRIDKEGGIDEYSSHYVRTDGSTVKYLRGNRVEHVGKGKDIKDPDRKIRAVRFRGGAEMLIGYQGTQSGGYADMSAVIMVRSSNGENTPLYHLKIDNIRNIVTDAKEDKEGIAGGTEISVLLNNGKKIKILVTGEGVLAQSEHVSFEGRDEAIVDALLVEPVRGEDGSMRFVLPDISGNKISAQEKAIEDYVALRAAENWLTEAFIKEREISWTYKGKQVRAIVKYDDIFEIFVVSPTEDYREEHPELDILHKPVAQTFIAPEGSFGQLEVRFKIINGEPAILFDEVHPSRGYRKLNGRQIRNVYRLWAENAIRKIITTVQSFGIQAFYVSRGERIKRRYDRQRVPVPSANLWENYEFPFKHKGWTPVRIENSGEELPVESEDQGGMLLWKLDAENYDFYGARADVAGDDMLEVDVMGQMGTVVPELVNGLMTAGYGEKVVIAIDEELGAGWTRKQLGKVMSALRHLSGRDDQLGRFLQNVVIRHGRGGVLARNLDALVEKGDVKKENIVIITSEANLKEHFSGFDGISTITGIDDKELTDDFYYPLIEIVLFTLARTLRYDRKDLVRCYRNIVNCLDLDDDTIWQMCWDPAANSYKTTMMIRLIPGAARIPGDRGVYHEIRQYIASRA